MRPTIKMPKGKKRPSPKEVRVVPKPKRARPRKNDPYMNQVVDLFDSKGVFLFRGTRRECVRFSKETFDERMGLDQEL